MAFASHILVTGSSGFVGAALCAELVARGERVIGVDRQAPPAALLAACNGSPGSFLSERADILDSAALARVFATHAVSHVVAAAAITADRSREQRDPAGIVGVNVTSIAETIRQAAAAGVGRVVYLGSGGAYGDSAREAELLTESTPLKPRSLYAITKQAGENVALRLADTFGIDVVVGRLGTCFGPFERATGVRDTLSPPFQVLAHAHSKTPVVLPRRGRRDWLYVRDAVAAIIALLATPRLPSPVYNLAAGFVWSIADWCEALRRRQPDLSWSIGPNPNVDLYDAFDRAPMDITRLRTDTGFVPRFDLDAAMDDFLRFNESGGWMAA